MRIIEIGTKLWKKAWKNDCVGYAIVELEVVEPGICADWESWEGVGYSRNDERKCRVRAAKVLSISTYEGYPLDSARSDYDSFFIYMVGDIVTPDKPWDDRNRACGSGIHGFETRAQAVDYYL